MKFYKKPFYLMKRFHQYRFLTWELVKKGIKLKYRRSYLGIVWSLLEPILTTIVLVIVFGTVLKNNNPTYPLYIMSGRLFYGFFSTGTNGCLSSIRRNASMIKKVSVPKVLYPFSTVLFNFIISSISILVLVGVDAYCKVIPTWHLIQFIPAMLFVFLLTFGVGLILTTLNVFFKDIEYLWNVVLMLVLYASAIFYYPEAILDSKFFWLLKYNPLYQCIKLGRDALMGCAFDLNSFAIAGVWSFGCVIFGYIFFSLKKDKFILHI